MFRTLRARILVNKNEALVSKIFNRHYVEYVQGQSPKHGIREYFYYINHEGMLFLDNTPIKNYTSCFKDKKFLVRFFVSMKQNLTNRYTEDFPYVSMCQRELNFIRCDDLPIVFTKIIQITDKETGEKKDWLSYAHTGSFLKVPFQPNKLHMDVNSGRLYHPAPIRGGRVGLVTSKLANDFSLRFCFENGEVNGPTHFTWDDKRYTLDPTWWKLNYRVKVENLCS